MDNFDLNKIPQQKANDDPIPFDSDSKAAAVPHIAPNSTAPPKPAVALAPSPSNSTAAARVVVSPSQKISKIHNFFCKLQPGSLEFLDQQINIWLKDNPGVVIKKTNTATGIMEGKKAEPSLIVTVWY